MNIEIREMAPEDEPGTRIVSKESHATLRKIYSPTPIAKQIGTEVPFTRLVALSAGQVVGMVTFEVDGKALYFGSLGVLENFRRQGIATAIVVHLEQTAKSQGFKKLTCATVKETGNVQIFEKLGFSVISSQLSDKFVSVNGEPVFEVRMEKLV